MHSGGDEFLFDAVIAVVEALMELEDEGSGPRLEQFARFADQIDDAELLRLARRLEEMLYERDFRTSALAARRFLQALIRHSLAEVPSDPMLV